MTQTLANRETYVFDFQALAEKGAAETPIWLREARRLAFDQFTELGFPTARRGNEKWKYTNVGPIADAPFQYPADGPSSIPAEADVRSRAPWVEEWMSLVFINGRYHEGLSKVPSSPSSVRVSSLSNAIRSDDGLIESRLAQAASMEEDAFIALNTAFVDDGALIHVPEGAVLEVPVHLLFISTGGDEPTVSYPRVLVVAGEGSRATIVESYVGLSQVRYFTDAVSEMYIGKGAEIDHYRLLLESELAFHVAAARVHQSEDSVFSSRTFEKGPALGRYDLNVTLDGPGSSCFLNGLYLTGGVQHMDNLVNIDHVKPGCTSRLYYKGILDGKSRAVFGGTVWVRKDAQKTDAMQSDKNLVLSPDAEVDSKPALFIYADDVKCGHGATAGNIDQDMVFYMRSRGIDLEAASRLLIYGFASEIIDTVREPQLRLYLEDMFLASLPSYRFEF